MEAALWFIGAALLLQAILAGIYWYRSDKISIERWKYDKEYFDKYVTPLKTEELENLSRRQEMREGIDKLAGAVGPLYDGLNTAVKKSL